MAELRQVCEDKGWFKVNPWFFIGHLSMYAYDFYRGGNCVLFYPLTDQKKKEENYGNVV